MTYEETCEYLFYQTANYESQGGDGYKPGLNNMLKLDEHYDHPHQHFKCIHVAGTNGKGSVSHTLAAMLQVCGYQVGLYTSPHLKDFSERIRINGQPIDEEYVIKFVGHDKEYFDSQNFTFFEITTEMAFNYFKDNNVDIAIIEVGLGGRLDSTNIITPLVSVITNISLDHTRLLGTSVEQIAMEKGGIIKETVPVIIGEASAEIRPVFDALAHECDAPIHYAEDEQEIISAELLNDNTGIYYRTQHFGEFKGQLCGEYQPKNTNTVLAAIKELCRQHYLCLSDKPETKAIFHQEIGESFLHVSELTGLNGRWQILRNKPTVVCDIGHNVGAWEQLSRQLANVKCKQMHIIFGMVDDKDIYGVMSLMPKNAIYYFTKPNTKRALPEQSIQVFAQQFDLAGMTYPTVNEAYSAALSIADNDDFIFVGGSNYVVADLLNSRV